jgi:NADH dehydrogenase
VAYIHGVKLRGFIAWGAWLVVHIWQLIGFRNRLLVMFDWIWQYLTYDRAVRLIESNEENRPLSVDADGYNWPEKSAQRRKHAVTK